MIYYKPFFDNKTVLRIVHKKQIQHKRGTGWGESAV